MQCKVEPSKIYYVVFQNFKFNTVEVPLIISEFGRYLIWYLSKSYTSKDPQQLGYTRSLSCKRRLVKVFYLILGQRPIYRRITLTCYY